MREMPFAGIELHCPECGRALSYIRSDRTVHFFRCERHQTVVFLPNGQIKVDDPNDSSVRH